MACPICIWSGNTVDVTLDAPWTLPGPGGPLIYMETDSFKWHIHDHNIYDGAATCNSEHRHSLRVRRRFASVCCDVVKEYHELEYLEDGPEEGSEKHCPRSKTSETGFAGADMAEIHKAAKMVQLRCWPSWDPTPYVCNVRNCRAKDCKLWRYSTETRPRDWDLHCINCVRRDLCFHREAAAMQPLAAQDESVPLGPWIPAIPDRKTLSFYDRFSLAPPRLQSWWRGLATQPTKRADLQKKKTRCVFRHRIFMR